MKLIGGSCLKYWIWLTNETSQGFISVVILKQMQNISRVEIAAQTLHLDQADSTGVPDTPNCHRGPSRISTKSPCYSSCLFLIKPPIKWWILHLGPLFLLTWIYVWSGLPTFLAASLSEDCILLNVVTSANLVQQQYNSRYSLGYGYVVYPTTDAAVGIDFTITEEEHTDTVKDRVTVT